MRKILPILLLSISLQSCGYVAANQKAIEQKERCTQIKESYLQKNCMSDPVKYFAIEKILEENRRNNRGIKIMSFDSMLEEYQYYNKIKKKTNVININKVNKTYLDLSEEWIECEQLGSEDRRNSCQNIILKENGYTKNGSEEKMFIKYAKRAEEKEILEREARIASRKAREKQEKLNPSQKQANTMAGLAMLANWLGSAYAIDYDQLDANMAQTLQTSKQNQFYNTIFQSRKIGNTLHYDNFSLEKNLNGTIDYLRLSNGQIIYAYPQSNTMGIIEFQNGLKGTLNSDGSFQFDSLSRPLESLDN